MRPLEPDDPRSVETGGRRYRVLARVGSGGMGVVYLGRSAAGRAVAIKTVHPEFAADPEFRDRFEREAAVARTVGGGFTAAVLDADPHADVPWLVTEFLPSVSVRDAVHSSGPLPADAVWDLAAGVAEALVSIHGAGVVHRDLKPANVLLTADGPRVIDFGVARAVEASSVSRPGARAGSAGFMSPEQAAGEAIGPASDVFSFGSTLAFAANGREPFGDGPWQAKLLRVQSEPPRLDGIADPDLRALIEACTARDPAARPTAPDLAERLAGRRDGPAAPPPPVAAEIARRRAAAENPPPPRPSLEPPADPAPVRAGRRRHAGVLVGVASAAALVVTAGGPAALWYATRDTGPEPAASASPTPSASAAVASSPPPSSAVTRGDIVFTIEGDGTLRTLTYMVDGKSTMLRNVKLPWKKSVPIPATPPRISWKLTYRAPSGGASHTVVVDGQPMGSGQGSAGTTMRAEGVY
ncbi:serine/threonine-protein kinase [Actinomadura chibensis]|uniref:serine/threonine-protein kinase n=1 Tax=Actinomadura chibensis TaxID=392828 RepID=UPI00082C27B8|nr:serine/threonine-protein kinase [Actinomadura chibensis]